MDDDREAGQLPSTSQQQQQSPIRASPPQLEPTSSSSTCQQQQQHSSRGGQFRTRSQSQYHQSSVVGRNYPPSQQQRHRRRQQHHQSAPLIAVTEVEHQQLQAVAAVAAATTASSVSAAAAAQTQTSSVDDDIIRESEKELRRVMKTVNDSFAECRRAVSPTGSETAAVTRSSSVASENSSTSDLMENFLSELDLVFNDILAEEDLKSFRHSMQTVSEASSPLLDDPVRSTTSPRNSVVTPTVAFFAAAQPLVAVNSTVDSVDSRPPSVTATAVPPSSSQRCRTDSTSRSPPATNIYVNPADMVMSSTYGGHGHHIPVEVQIEPVRPNSAHHVAVNVVPLAVLDEFSLTGSATGAGLGTDSEMDSSSVVVVSSTSSARIRRTEYGRSSVRARTAAAATTNGAGSNNSGAGGLSRDLADKQSSVAANGPMTSPTVAVQLDVCVVDLNSNAKDQIGSNAKSAQNKNHHQRAEGSTRLTSGIGAQTTANLPASGAPSRYDNWDRSLFDEEVNCNDVTAELDDVSNESAAIPMLEFAESYYNAHPAQQAGYHSAIVRTVNMVARKSLSEFVPVEDLLRFTKNSTIIMSHVRLIDSDNIPIACSMFKDLHRYMRGSVVGGSLVRSMISHCLQRRELRDELYCQLVRMTSDIPAHVPEDHRCRLWTLFCLCSVSFSPSHSLRKYLIAHLRRVVRVGASQSSTGPESTIEDSKVTLYAKYCLRHIATPRTQTRRLPPSNAEIEAMSKLQPLIYRIHFLDGKTKAIVVECSETSADALCRVSSKIGLQSTYGWALYESLPDHDRYIRSSEYLADVLSDWEEKQRVEAGNQAGTPKKVLVQAGVDGRTSPQRAKTHATYGKLVLCKRFCQRIGDDIDDPTELRLLYHQAVHYVVHLDEFQVPVNTSLHLAGLQAQVEFGHYDATKTIRYVEHDEFLSQRVKLDNKDWTMELAAAHKRYGKNKSTLEAMRRYLAMVAQFPLYGCTKVFAHYRGIWAYGVETIIAVNYDGIKLISVSEKKLAVELCYPEIEEIQLLERHGECHVIFQLSNNVAQGRQKTFLFECLELEELASLIECYSPAHATWTGRGTGGIINSWKYDQNKPVEDWHRLYDNILQCRRVLLQSGIVKSAVQEEVGFLRSAFNRISGRNCSSLSRAAHRCGSESPGVTDGIEAADKFNDASLHGAYWAFTKIPFKTSLLAGQTHEIEDIAVRMFNTSLVYSGLEFSASLDDMDLFVVVQTLLHKCMENDSLCNECFLQLIKQTTDTKTGPEHRSKNIPVLESSIRAVNQYWHMLTMATCVMVPPCPIVLTYLRLHLHRYGMLENADEGKFARFCARSLHRTFQNRGRKYPPSYKEILFVTKRQPIEGRVYLTDGHPMLIEFDSAATAAEVIQMVKAKAGMRLDADGFALFQIVKEREEYIAPEVKLADCLYQWEKSSKANHSSSRDFKLIFKKRLFVEPFINLNDPVEIDLLYNQSVTDVFDQKIPLTKSDAIQLCALRAQAEYGDHGHANNFDYTTVVRILPRHLRELTMSAEIRAVHESLIGTSPLIANVMFLEILKQWPLYGAILFEVTSSLEHLPKTIWLAVSQLGLHLMEYKGQTVYITYPFEDIVSTTTGNKSLTVTISSESPPSNTLVFFTLEGAQVVQLISDYREVLARRRKPNSIPDEQRTTSASLSIEDAAVGASSHHQMTSSVSGVNRRQREQRRKSATTAGTGKVTLQPSKSPRSCQRESQDGQQQQQQSTASAAVHRSPTSSPERDSKEHVPLLTNRANAAQPGGSRQGGGQIRYHRVVDGSRHTTRRSQFRNSRLGDSRHEGIFE